MVAEAVKKLGIAGVLATTLFGWWGGPCWGWGPGWGPGWGYWNGAAPQLTQQQQQELSRVYQRLLLTNKLYSLLATKYPNTPFPNLTFWTSRQLGWVGSWLQNPPPTPENSLQFRPI